MKFKISAEIVWIKVWMLEALKSDKIMLCPYAPKQT